MGSSYSRRGQTPMISGTGPRFGCNMISVITNKERFQSDVFQELLRCMVKQSKRNAFLIFDAHPVYRSGKVKRWLKKHEEHIRLFFLKS